MKVIAFNGSPRKNGNTNSALKQVCTVLEKSGIDTEIIHVGNKNIKGCMACNVCMKTRNEKCVNDNDEVNEWIQKLKDTDGILLGSPVHFSSMAANMKAFLDRAFYVSGANGNLFRYKVGAAVVAVRRSGGLPVFNELNNYMLYSEMFVPASNYWNVIHGTKPDEISNDPEGMQIMQQLGHNMAFLMKSLHKAKGDVDVPQKPAKIYTNFVR